MPTMPDFRGGFSTCSSVSDFPLVLISASFLSQGGYAERSGSIHPGDELLSVDGRDIGSIQDPAGTI